MFEEPIDDEDEIDAMAARDAEPPPVAAPEVVKVIARAAEQLGVARVSAGPQDEWVSVPCRLCAQPVAVLKDIVTAVKNWNKREQQRGVDAERGGLFHKPDLISNNQLVCCDGACTLAFRQQIEREAAQERATTEHHLDRMKLGRLSHDGEVWLQRHGYWEEVKEYRSSPPPEQPEHPTGAST